MEDMKLIEIKIDDKSNYEKMTLDELLDSDLSLEDIDEILESRKEE